MCTSRQRPLSLLQASVGDSLPIGTVATAAREDLPIIFAVLNNEHYGMVEAGNMGVYGRTPAYPAGPLDVADVGRSVGAHAIRIEKPGALLELDLVRMTSQRPVVLDIRVDRSIRLSRARVDFIKHTANRNAVN